MKSFINNTLICFITILFSILISIFMVEIFFRKGPFMIIYFSIPFSILISLILSLVLACINLMLNYIRNIYFYILSFMVIATPLLIIGWINYSPPDKILIKKYITKTIPSSLSNTHSVIEYPAIDHIIRVSFTISNDDFNKYIFNKNYKLSNDDFPYRLPIINSYKWWNFEKLKTLKQYKLDSSGSDHYLWYDEINNSVYFLRVR